MNSRLFTNNVFQNFIDILQFRSCSPHSFQQTLKCNYNCPVCRTSRLSPNIAGRFHIITPTQCQCNGCNTIFEKSMFYAQPENPLNPDGRWVCSPTDYDIKSEIGTQPESVL